MRLYYCLVAGMPDIVFDGSKVNLSIEWFRNEVYPELDEDDAEKIDLFFYAWDNENIIKILRHGADVDLPRTGCYSREELAELIASVKSGDIHGEDFPEYMYDFLEYYFANENREGGIFEDVLAAYYYNYAVDCGNEFLSEWFAFNRNLNNLQVAFIARKFKKNVADYVVGDDEISETIRTSSTRDFGLTGELDYLETVQRLCEMDKLQERERQFDELRWNWLDDNSSFIYFSFERIFVFLQKLDIVLRWSKLDAESGMARYKELIEGLKSGLTINDEDYQ